MIVDGLVERTAEVRAQLAAGSITLGGCRIDLDNPEWCCRACGHRWGESAQSRAILHWEMVRDAERGAADAGRRLGRLSFGRLKILDLMILVTVAAGMLAIYRLWLFDWAAVAPLLMLLLLASAVSYSVRTKLAGRALLVATWVSSLWPLATPISFHLAWAFAYAYLGREPRPTDTDIGQPLAFLGLAPLSCYLSALVAPLICLGLPLGAVAPADGEDRRWNPQVIPLLLSPVAWLVVAAILCWDPLGAASYWFD